MQGVQWPALWGRITELVTAALFAAQDAIPHSPNAFELFGFDVMIDAQLKARSSCLTPSPPSGPRAAAAHPSGTAPPLRAPLRAEQLRGLSRQVWLLEVNSSPSLGLDTPLDVAVKPRLLADVLRLLAPLPFDRAALAGVLRARTSTGGRSTARAGLRARHGRRHGRVPGCCAGWGARAARCGECAAESVGRC
jgi:hypothetical protein